MQLRTVSILGVGLLGGSIGLAVKERISGCRVVGYGHRQSSLDEAVRRGAIDQGCSDPALAVQGADLVILCTPVGVFADMLRGIRPAVGRALITDVGSTKRSVAKLAGEILSDPSRFVGSHPMAGSEKRGIQFGRADLCDGALCLVTPTERTDPAAVSDVEAFWQVLGMRTLRLSPADHDRRVAQISHLPHALAAVIVGSPEPESLELAGRGFLDLTRIAAGDGALWRDILIDNRDNMRECIDQIVADLGRFAELLDPEKGEELRKFLDAAADRRAGIGLGRAKPPHHPT
jgi:prephenate dehydrogenase